MIRLVLSLLLAFPLAACSEREAKVPEAAGANASAAAVPSDTAPTGIASAPVTVSAAPTSRYTSLKDCKVTESNDEEDWAISACPGIGGWKLQRDYGDAREYLRLAREHGSAKPKQIAMGYSGFNNLGETIEWRGSGEGHDFAPKALILRNFVSEDPEHSERTTALLMVIDLEQGCIIGEVRPGPGQNEAARAISDAPQRSCTKE
jgi:hypothetical protein